MANLRYVTKNLVEPASLAASPALATALPVGNLVDARRSRPARTTGLASQRYTGDFASNTTVNFMLLWGLNLTDNATWRLRIYSGLGQTGTTLVDSGVSSPWAAGLFDSWPTSRRFIVSYFTQQTTASSWRVDITDPANQDGYMDVGELWLGSYTELGFNFNWGAELRDGDNSSHQRTAGGGGFRKNISTLPWREIGFSMSHMTSAEAADWGAIARNNDRFWVDLYPDNSDPNLARDYALLAQLKSKQPRRRQRSLRHSLKATLTED